MGNSKSSDQNLNQSLVDVTTASTSEPTATKRSLSRYQWVLVVSLALIALGFGIAYGVIIPELEDRVEDANRVCSSDDPGADMFKDPAKQQFRLYFYNITNPVEVLQGEQHKLHELGSFGYSFTNHRYNIVYNDDDNTVSVDDWAEINYQADKSCDNCDPDQNIWSYNVAFNTLLGTAYNEATLMLNFVCSSEQFKYIYNESATYCELDQLGGEELCRCCSTVPDSPEGIPCTELATPFSQPGGILSMLAKYDGGFKMSDELIDTFLFVDGVYTPFIKASTPNQILNGYPSGYVGFIATQRTIGSSGVSSELVQDNAQTTGDMKAVCYPLYCPSYEDLAVGLVDAGLDFSYFQNVSCAGLVPSTDVLMDELGMSEDEANQYRYLEGTQCDVFSTAVILASLVTAVDSIGLPSYITCADSSEEMPCCPAEFSAGGIFAGAGLGCLQYISGMYTERRVFSDEEATEYLGPDNRNKHKTGCASAAEKFEQVIFKGSSNFSKWYTPDDYEYGVTPMNWADPSVYLYGSDHPETGHMLIGNVSGKQFSFREGRGVTSDFLEYQLTDGDPLSRQDEIWVPYKRSAINTIKTGSRKIEGIHVNDFYPDMTVDYSPEARAEAERSGQNPYPNVQNLLYSSDGRTVITSYPNFFLTDTAEALSQTDNSERLAPAGGGVSLYRTLSKYPNGALLEEPELITTDTWAEFGPKYYDGYQSIEPATGATIGGQLANMMSVFSWNCNPALNMSLCDLMTYVNNGTMCYSEEGSPYMYPCNAANVFTPMVQGGKVTPVWWLYATPDADEAYDIINYAMDVRFSLSILVLIMPILCVIGIGVTVWYALWYEMKKQ